MPWLIKWCDQWSHQLNCHCQQITFFSFQKLHFVLTLDQITYKVHVNYLKFHRIYFLLFISCYLFLVVYFLLFISCYKWLHLHIHCITKRFQSRTAFSYFSKGLSRVNVCHISYLFMIVLWCWCFHCLPPIIFGTSKLKLMTHTFFLVYV